jgi:hypothetical protein
MNLQVPWNAGKFSSSCTIGTFSRRAQLHEWVREWVGGVEDDRREWINRLTVIISFSMPWKQTGSRDGYRKCINGSERISVSWLTRVWKLTRYRGVDTKYLCSLCGELERSFCVAMIQQSGCLIHIQELSELSRRVKFNKTINENSNILKSYVSPYLK